LKDFHAIRSSELTRDFLKSLSGKNELEKMDEKVRRWKKTRPDLERRRHYFMKSSMEEILRSFVGTAAAQREIQG
jgi:hypothetical protein